MNKGRWKLPLLILIANILAIVVRWGSLQEFLPAHFDLDGNASGVIPRNMVLMQPLIGAVVCMIAYLIARIKQELQTGLIILASGIGLVLLMSTLVTLTSGKVPFFMISEPIILLASLVSFIICVIKSRKQIEKPQNS